MSELQKGVCKSCGGKLDVDSKADAVVCPFCGTTHAVAEILGESDAVRLEKMRSREKREQEERFMEKDAAEREKWEKKNALDLFKKSKFCKVLIIFVVISILCCIGAFTSSHILAGIVAVLQAAGFLTAWLMGMQVIPEKKHNFRLIPTVVAFVLFVPFICLCSVGGEDTKKGSSASEETSAIVWEDLILGDKLPEFKNAQGEIWDNSVSSLNVDLDGVSAKEYLEYLEKCKSMEYTVDVRADDWDYIAYNADGYCLELTYYDYSQELSVELDAPMEMHEYVWPSGGLPSLLPTPTFEYGNVDWDSETNFRVNLSGVSEGDYRKYVDACKEKGFVVDYTNRDYEFYAYDAVGNHLDIEYIGNGVVRISITAADPQEKKTTQAPTTTQKPTTTEATTKKVVSTGIRPEFKKAMDSYEQFIDEYVAFMKKYTQSSDIISMMTDYANYLDKYAQLTEDFEAWENSDLNDAELAYYMQVQLRTSQKLMAVAM